MSFFGKQQRRAAAALFCAVAICAQTSCERAASREQKALRAELRRALSEHSYDTAIQSARRLLKSKPQDNGTWDCLVQAQFGQRDLPAVKLTLADWRGAVRHPSPNLDEYSGDLVLEENDPSAALQAWAKVIAVDPKNLRVLEKVARLEAKQHHWTEASAAWSAHLGVHDNALARINRALCQRHLHRWPDAFEDLHRAVEFAPDDPEVQRCAKLFERTGKFLAEMREVDAAIAVSPNDPGLLADRALMFLRSEDYDLALEDSEAALKAGPWAMRPKLFQSIALIALGRSDDCDRLAVQKFIRLETLAPEFLETMSRLDSEISVERNNADLYIARAWQLSEIGQPALALQDAENAARLDVKSAGAWVESSYALMKLQRPDEAFQQIKRATELDPNLSIAWQYRGELEMERGQFLSAIESLGHALEHNQTVAALQKREQCYRRLGLQAKADQDHRMLESLDRRASQ